MIGTEERELFCAGHTLDESGNVIFSGGHEHPWTMGDNHGIKDMWMYKWQTNALVQLEDMTNGRWYPTSIQLPDRTIMTLMGSYCGGPPHTGPCTTVTRNKVPELWTFHSDSASPTNHNEDLAESDMNIYYPHMFIHPLNEKPYFAASGRPGSTPNGDGIEMSRLFNPETLVWEEYGLIPANPFPNVRNTWPSGVMMDGVIYRTGGSISDASNHDAVKSTVKLDLNATNPAWVQMSDMDRERKNHTLVALPDGRILAMGGNLNEAIVGSDVRATPEALDTESTNPTWLRQEDPDTIIGRGYHSTVLLLPDARVIFAGGERLTGVEWNIQRKPQFFTPHYGGDPNWAASRPVITSGPSGDIIRYGETFEVDVSVSPSGSRSLSKFRLISLGATTHAFNQNQQYVTLTFTPHATVANRYVVNAPANTFKATPGYYMLFAVDNNRFPSVAKIVQLKDFVRAFPTSITPGYGSFPQTTPQLSESLLGDNKYLGSSISSVPQDPSIATVNVTSQFTAGAYVKSRITVECRTSQSTNYEIHFKNYTTGVFDIVKTGTIGNTDTKIEHTVVPGGLTPYISSTGEVEAHLRFEQPEQALFNLFIDKIEFGVR